MGPIHIACSADESYLPHVSAMLHSLLAHTPRRPLSIWLTHGADLSPDGRARVGSVAAAANARIEFVRVPGSMLHGLSLRKFHPACWYRVLLPDLLPELERILYLDADIVAADDIAPLWETDLGESLFAAVDNPLYPFMRKWPERDLNIADPLAYLNSGVLLLDLRRLRTERLIERLREYSTRNPDRLLPEQDALSVVARGRWLRVHPRWNVQTPFYEVAADRFAHPPAVVTEAVQRPALIHFNGWFKPWHFASSHPERGRYFAHLRQTPWPEQPLQFTNWGYRLIRPLPPVLQYGAVLRREDWRKAVNSVRRVWSQLTRFAR